MLEKQSQAEAVKKREERQKWLSKTSHPLHQVNHTQNNTQTHQVDDCA